MIIHVFISRGLDNDTYRNLICFLFDYFYLHVYFIVQQDSIDEKYNDIVLGFIQKNNKVNWYSIEVTFEYKPVIKNNCISLEIKYSYDNIGDAGCDATPEEIKLVKNIIKQIKNK